MFKLFLFDEGGEAAAEPSTADTPSASPEGESGSQPEEEKLYTKSDMSKAIQERLRSSKAREAENSQKISQYGEIHRILTERYGTDDLAELQDRLIGDDLYVEAESVKRNMSKEATKLQLEREYREKREFARAKAEADEAKRQADVLRWRGEEAELKKTFPNFDLSTEFEDPKFANLLMNNVSVEDAYMALHAKDILQGSVQVAFAKGKETVAASIAANANRPLENGVSSKPAVNTRKDISKLTNAEMDEIDAQVRRGERVTFR